MVKKCLFCNTDVEETSVIDFCERCGVSHFGRKLFDVIKNNMEEARERGDLCHQNSPSLD